MSIAIVLALVLLFLGAALLVAEWLDRRRPPWWADLRSEFDSDDRNTG
jgi:hypothetical protein